MAKTIDKLTAREREILTQIAKGQPSKVIAANLAISIRTVETHRKNIYLKLNVHSIAEAVAASCRWPIQPA